MANDKQDTTSNLGEPAPSIHVRNVRLRLGSTLLFEDFSIDVVAGGITCLLGLSGIGKSSLLKLIAGLGPSLQSGSVQADDGKPISDRVAYMDQRDLLLPWLNILDNVTLGARLRGVPQDRDSARDLLRNVGLAGREYDRPALLSGGMRQRAALARTLMENRPIVLMDEPFSALDALTRLQLQDLAGHSLKDRTVLLVTHDPFEAARLGHRVHVMAGQPAQIDSILTFSGTPPRDPVDTQITSYYQDIMRRLHQVNSRNTDEAEIC